MQPASENPGPIWSRHAKKVALKVNAGWWLQSLGTPLVLLGLVGACVLLFVRRLLPAISPEALAGGSVGAVLLVAAIAWLIARRHFEKPEQSMVRIEAAMMLRNALSAAKAGVAPWPPAPAQVNADLDWRWKRVLVPPAAAILFLSAGLLIPLSAVSAPPGAQDELTTWRKLEADLDRLDQDRDVFDESYVEEMQKKLNELKAQDQDQWFSQASLEATDALKQKHVSELEKLDRELQRAKEAMAELQKNDALSTTQKESLINQLDQALQNLDQGALKPNSKLMEQLKAMDPNSLSKMDPEKLKQLKDAMKKASQAAKDLKGQKGEGKGDQWSDELNDGDDKGDGSGDGEGQGGDGDGDQPGSGGVSRGPGHSPGMLGKERKRTDIGDMTPIESKDLSNSLPSDLLELQNTEHDVDKTARGPQSGGATGATGAGGERVWKESLDPAEQKALKKFFE